MHIVMNQTVQRASLVDYTHRHEQQWQFVYQRGWTFESNPKSPPAPYINTYTYCYKQLHAHHHWREHTHIHSSSIYPSLLLLQSYNNLWLCLKPISTGVPSSKSLIHCFCQTNLISLCWKPKQLVFLLKVFSYNIKHQEWIPTHKWQWI